MHEAWTALDGQTGVYYRLVENSTADQVFPVLKNDQIFVKDSLTEEQLDAVTENPKLVFTAYAAQSDGLASAQAAWQILSEGKEE